MTIKRMVAGVLPLLFVVASAGHASPLPSCKSRFCYYRVSALQDRAEVRGRGAGTKAR